MSKPIDWLNYQHLLYFWMVARHGTVAEAARRLHLTSPTISAQIHKLERSVGQELLRPNGRLLEMTEAGRVAMQYAEEIFGLGAELAEALSGRLPEGRLRLRVGVVDAVPKLVVHRLLKPLLSMKPTISLQCSEGMLGALVEDLATHRLDVILSDSQTPPGGSLRVFNHLLGDSSISWFASDALIPVTDSRPLDALLATVPLLLPSRETALRPHLDRYFDDRGISPQIAHEFHDSALMKAFGEAGSGMFPGPSVVQSRLCRQYSVRRVARMEAVRESFYAITAERQIRHPATELLTRAARQSVGEP